MITISINPVAFHIGFIEVRWYGIIVAIAVAVVALWMVRQINVRKPDLPSSHDIIIAPVGIISGMIGAKLVHILERLDSYIQNPADILSRGGLAIYGAVIGATLGIWIYLKLSHHDVERQHFGFYIDLVAPGIILAQAIGRIGCTINGCCHGKVAPDWLPWAISYSSDYPPPDGYSVQSPYFLDKPLYPTQPYEIIFCLIGFAILLKLRGRLKPDGSLFLFYLAIYSAWRLGIGFLRTDMQFIFGLSQAQLISIVVLAVCIALLVYRKRRVKAKL